MLLQNIIVAQDRNLQRLILCDKSHTYLPNYEFRNSSCVVIFYCTIFNIRTATNDIPPNIYVSCNGHKREIKITQS